VVLRNSIPASRARSAGTKFEDEDSFRINQPVIKYRDGSVMTLDTDIRGTKPRVFQDDRVCNQDGCTKRLSRYNKGPECYQHQPIRSPRIRGKI